MGNGLDEFLIKLILIDQNSQTRPQGFILRTIKRQQLQHCRNRIRLMQIRTPYHRHDIVMNILLIQPYCLTKILNSTLLRLIWEKILY